MILYMWYMQRSIQYSILKIVSIKMNSAHRLNIILNHLHGTLQPSARITSSAKYLYTVDNNVLSNEQRTFYEENGYLIIRNLVDHQLLDECKNRFIDICNGKVDAGQMILMKEKCLLNTDATGEYLINKLHDILYDDVFRKYVKNPSLLKYVECFTGPDITLFQSMILNKPPCKGHQPAIHPMHQDLCYFPIRPADRIVGTWTALEKATVDNGCLFVVPGSHKTPLQPHDYPKCDVNFMCYEVKGFDLIPRVHLEMEKGDTVFFHPLLLHGSGPNITKGFRKALASHYASSNCHFIENLDDIVKKDMQKVFRLKGLTGSDQESQFRHMLIQGKRGVLQQV